MNTYYLKTTIFLVLNFIGLFALCSCAENEVENPHKGAKLPVMQSIADNVPYIQSVDKEESYQLVDGIHIVDVTFTYCRKPTRMLIAEIDLTKDVTISVSTPDNLDEVGSKLQTVAEQAMCAEKAGKHVYLATNGDYFSESTTAAGTWIPSEEITAQSDIPLGHKISTRSIRKGEPILKYNTVIGYASRDVEAGTHMHNDTIHFDAVAQDAERLIKQMEELTSPQLL